MYASALGILLTSAAMIFYNRNDKDMDLTRPLDDESFLHVSRYMRDHIST